MKITFQHFTASWQGPDGIEWPIWIAARSADDAGVCAQLTFALLEAQARNRSQRPA